MNNKIQRVLIEETNQIIRVKPMFMYSKHNYKSRVWNTQTEHYLCKSLDLIKIDNTIRSNVLLICHESLDRVKKFYKNEELLICQHHYDLLKLSFFHLQSLSLQILK